jgi:hypothetical protein
MAERQRDRHHLVILRIGWFLVDVGLIVIAPLVVPSPTSRCPQASFYCRLNLRAQSGPRSGDWEGR